MNLNFRFILLYRSRKILRKNFKEDLASIFECYVLLLSPKPVIPKISIWLKKKENKKKKNERRKRYKLWFKCTEIHLRGPEDRYCSSVNYSLHLNVLHTCLGILECFSRRQNTKYKIFLFKRDISSSLRESRFQAETSR